MRLKAAVLDSTTVGRPETRVKDFKYSFGQKWDLILKTMNAYIVSGETFQ